MDGRANGQIDEETDGWTDRWVDGQTYWRIDGQMDKWTDEWQNGWTNKSGCRVPCPRH